MSPRYTSYLFYLFLIAAIQCTLPFTANQKYSYAGKATVNIGQQITINGGAYWGNGINVTIIYPRSYDYNLNVTAIASIGDFTSDYLSDGIYLFLQAIEISKNSLMISIFTANASKIQKLVSSYFLYLYQSIDEYNFVAYENIYSFGYLPRVINSNPLTWYTISFNIPPFNLTTQTRSLVFLAGIQAYGGFLIAYSIFFDLSMKNSTFMVLTIGSNSIFNTELYIFFVQMFNYNPSFAKKTAISYQFYDGSTKQANSNYGSFVSDGRIIKQFNTLYGLSAFSISFTGTFSLSMTFQTDKSMGANAGVTFDSFTYKILMIYSSYCEYKTKYYEDYNELCYQTCPSTMKSSLSELKCICLDQNNDTISNLHCSLNQTTNITATNLTNTSTSSNTTNNSTSSNTTDNSTSSNATDNSTSSTNNSTNSSAETNITTNSSANSTTNATANTTTNSTSNSTSANSTSANTTNNSTSNNLTNSSTSDNKSNLQNSPIQQNAKNQSSISSIIIGVTISSISFIVIIIVIYCCKKRRKSPPQTYQVKQQIKFDGDSIINIHSNQNIQSPIKQLKKPNQNSYSILIKSSDQIVIHSTPLNQTTVHQRAQLSQFNNFPGHSILVNDEIQIQQPIYHPVTQARKAVDKHSNECSPRQVWNECPKYNAKEQCSICIHAKSQLKIACDHFFHIQCIIGWMKKDTTCPNCRKIISIQANYYCKKCGVKQKIINLMARENLQTMRKLCNQCG